MERIALGKNLLEIINPIIDSIVAPSVDSR